MKITRPFSVLALFASASITLAQVIPGQYIAVFKDGVQNHLATVPAVAAQHGLAVSHVYEHSIKGFAFAGTAQAAAALAQRADIAYVEADQVIRANATQEIPTGINRADVEKAVAIDGTDELIDVDIAIIDTGLDSDHPDLRIDPAGVRFYSSIGGRIRSDTNWEDDNGHGSHVGGTAAAKDNGLGVVGVAPGARLTAVKVLDRNGSGSTAGVAAGVDWVAARAARFEVANMSLGGGYSQALNDAVKNAVAKGVVFVVAAGNESSDAGSTSPASEPSAITVSALADRDGLPGGLAAGDDDTFATFSNFGLVVDICAPGVGILSSVPGGGYASYSGTSMASPHVAGAAALYVSRKGLVKTAAGVAAVAQALTSRGWQAGDAEYILSGDPDSVREPLLNVGELFNAAPTVSIRSPLAGDKYRAGETVIFSATALDEEEGDKADSLVWSSNLSGPIVPTAAERPDLFSAVLPEGTHTITARATDSLGASGSASVTIAVGVPIVSITSPSAGAKFNTGDTIQFRGSATDDGSDVTGSLVWTSSRDGQIGSGGSFPRVLSDGTHTITATAGSGGVFGSASITITVGSAIVVPSGFETVDDDGYSGTFWAPLRQQTVYAASHFKTGPVTIKGLAFRLDNISEATAGNIELRVKLSTSTVQPDNMSSTFSANVGANEVEVFPKGTVNFIATKGKTPNEFEILIPFANTFTHNPAAGNLLVDIITYSVSSPVATVDASNEKTDGASRAFASDINAKRATTRDTGADVLLLKLQ